MRVRRMNAADVARVMEIASNLKDAPRWPEWAYLEAVQLESHRRIALVAEGSGTGEVAGFLVAGLVLPDAELEMVAVTAEHQRRGVGRLLIGALIEELKRREGTAVLLEARASNVAAVELYRTSGFRETGRRQRYYADPIEDAVLMKLVLSV